MSDVQQSLLLRALRREPTARPPIWLMRQAGRYLAEYRQLREKVGFIDLCRDPRLCAEVMAQTVERIGVDAAILFSDLLLILEAMGLHLEFSAGEGPVLHNPIRDAEDVGRLEELTDVGRIGYVFEAVRQTRAALPAGMPLIGFAGAPFTLAAYAVEGGGSRDFRLAKSLMLRSPAAWQKLLERIGRSVAAYLNAQIDAGAHVVQVFDSWLGCIGPDDYRRHVLPATRELIAAIRSGVPVIYFATGNPALLPLLREALGDRPHAAVGCDWRVRLDDAWRTVGHDVAIQGNLDPVVLLSTPDLVRQRARELLEQAEGRPGHIFNLGHGVLPQTPVENVLALVEAVKEGGV